MHLHYGSFAYYVVQWLIVAASLFVTSLLVPGFQLRNFSAALWAAIVLGLVNLTIRPLLMFLAFPMNILSFGLFVFVVNAAVLKICAAVLKDFQITSWIAAILGAVLFAFVQSGFYYLFF